MPSPSGALDPCGIRAPPLVGYKADVKTGTALVGYYLRLLQAQDLKFPIAEIASLVNSGDESDKYIQGLISMVNSNPNFEPIAQATLVQSSMMVDKTASNGDENVGVSGLLCVYRILRWMTKGRDWDPVTAEARWEKYYSEYPTRDEDRMEFFGANMTDDRRFAPHPELAPDAKFLDYSKEDWSRALCLLVAIFVAWKTIWDQLSDKRTGEVFVIPYDSEEAVALDIAADDAPATEQQKQRLAALEAFSSMAPVGEEDDLHESMFRSVITKFVNKRASASEAAKLDFVSGMEDVRDQVTTINEYLGLTYKNSVVSDMNKPEKYRAADTRVVSAI